SPVCHQHYLCLLLPTVMALLALAWENPDRVWLRRVLRIVLPSVALSLFLPFVPIWGVLRDHGLPGAAALVLWGMGCVVLRLDPDRHASVMDRAPQAGLAAA